MAHQAVETRLAQPACEVTDAKHHKETDHTLREFLKSTEALRNMLNRNRSFNDLELLRLENHFHALQLAYLGWKRKQRVLSPDSAGSPPLNYDARSGPILPR
jgi:hypothetical protein